MPQIPSGLATFGAAAQAVAAHGVVPRTTGEPDPTTSDGGSFTDTLGAAIAQRRDERRVAEGPARPNASDQRDAAEGARPPAGRRKGARLPDLPDDSPVDSLTVDGPIGGASVLANAVTLVDAPAATPVDEANAIVGGQATDQPAGAPPAEAASLKAAMTDAAPGSGRRPARPTPGQPAAPDDGRAPASGATPFGQIKSVAKALSAMAAEPATAATSATPATTVLSATTAVTDAAPAAAVSTADAISTRAAPVSPAPRAIPAVPAIPPMPGNRAAPEAPATSGPGVVAGDAAAGAAVGSGPRRQPMEPETPETATFVSASARPGSGPLDGPGELRPRGESQGGERRSDAGKPGSSGSSGGRGEQRLDMVAPTGGRVTTATPEAAPATGAEAVATSAPVAGADIERLLDRVVHQIRAIGTTADPALEARLQDPDLGTVRVLVAGRSGETIRAELFVADQRTADALRQAVDRTSTSHGLVGIDLRIRTEPARSDAGTNGSGARPDGGRPSADQSGWTGLAGGTNHGLDQGRRGDRHDPSATPRPTPAPPVPAIAAIRRHQPGAGALDIRA